MTHSGKWDDLRYVLAVANHGSISAAARSLGVNHATVLRRVAAFEEAHGGVIFERTPQGYRVLPDRVRVIEAAREVDAMFNSVGRLMHGATSPLRGVVRVASTDTFCQAVLPGIVADLEARESALRIEILCSNTHHDFSRLQADVTVRPAVALPEDLVGASPARLKFRAYALPGGRDTWLQPSGPLSRALPARWIADHVEPETIAASADSFIVLRNLAEAGLGRSFIPAVLVAPDSRLETVADTPEFDVPIWVATHADLDTVPRIRAVRVILEARLAELAEVLEGREPPGQAGA